MKSFKPNPNYSIEVFDDILSPSQIEDIDTALKLSYYTYQNYDAKINSFPKLFNTFVKNGKCNREWESIFKIMMNSISNILNPNLLTQCLPTLKMQTNLSNLSTVDCIHQDLYEPLEGYTILYYANKEWDVDYGGETLFYNELTQEIICAVKPSPGRFVIFDSKLFHSARPPQKNCSHNRYTIAIKFRTDHLKTT